LVDLALWASKQVRCQTAITENVVSMGSLAQRRISRKLAHRERQRVVFVGAGHFIKSILPTFAKSDTFEFVFVNRTLPVDLAEAHGGAAISLADFLTDPVPFEAMVTATGAPTALFDGAWFAEHAPHAIILDAALPADVDMQGAPETVDYMALEEMEHILADNRAARAAEIPKAAPIFKKGFERLQARWLEFDLAQYNREIRDHYQAAGDRAMSHLMKDLDQQLGEREQEAVRKAMNTLIGKLTTVPILGLKSVAAELGEPAIDAYTRGVSARSSLFSDMPLSRGEADSANNAGALGSIHEIAPIAENHAVIQAARPVANEKPSHENAHTRRRASA
jgi:glutamyl-tRNA reductase